MVCHAGFHPTSAAADNLGCFQAGSGLLSGRQREAGVLGRDFFTRAQRRETGIEDSEGCHESGLRASCDPHGISRHWERGFGSHSEEHLDVGEKPASFPELEGSTEGCGGGDSMVRPEGTRSRGSTAGGGCKCPM